MAGNKYLAVVSGDVSEKASVQASVGGGLRRSINGGELLE